MRPPADVAERDSGDEFIEGAGDDPQGTKLSGAEQVEVFEDDTVDFVREMVELFCEGHCQRVGLTRLSLLRKGLMKKKLKIFCETSQSMIIVSLRTIFPADSENITITVFAIFIA